MNRPQTIQIFLPSGDPRGMRVAEITTRIVRVIEVPRSQLGDFLRMPEAQQVGVYFLMGELSEAGMPRTYIGQSGNVGKRLEQHHQNKDFWNRAFVVISLTNSLTQTHGLFLEWLAIAEATKAGRYGLENGNTGSQPYTPAPLQADCHEIHETAATLLATLGQPIFEPLTSAPTAKGIVELFYCKGSGADGGSGRCFPSGHASAGFSFIGGFFAFRGNDAGQARLGRAAHGGHADGRHVHVGVLDRLGRLGQDAARRAGHAADGLGQLTHAAQHGVGAFLGLDRQNQAITDHSPLTNIQTPDLPGHMQGAVDIGLMLRSRLDPAQGTSTEGQVGLGLMGPFDGKALTGKGIEDDTQQGIITLACRRYDRRQQGQALEVGFERLEVRATDIAHQADGLTAGTLQGLDALADLGNPDIGPGKGCQLRPGKPLEPDDEDRPPGLFAMLGNLERQGPATRDQAEFHHLRPRAPAGTGDDWRLPG